MNENQFKIFRKWRENKRENDLIKLRNDLARNGGAIGTERENAEKILKDECDSEIKMEEEKMKEYEKEKNDQKRERMNFIWTNTILAVVALLSLLLQVLNHF